MNSGHFFLTQIAGIASQVYTFLFRVLVVLSESRSLRAEGCPEMARYQERNGKVQCKLVDVKWEFKHILAKKS